MKVAKNYLYNLLYEAIALIVPLVLTPYISRVLLVDGVGKYSLSTAILNYFILFGMLGINVYGNRQIAYSRDDLVELGRTFWEINILKWLSMGVSILVYCIFVLVAVDEDLKSLYFANIFTLVASLVDISWFFIGMENFKVTTIKNCLVKIISVIVVILFVKKPSDIALYALIISIGTLAGQFSLWFSIPRNMKRIQVSWDRIPFHLKKTAHLWLPSIATQVYASLDKIMLGYLIDDIQVGLYESTQKVIRMASVVTTSFATASLPHMANMFNNKRYADIKNLAEHSLSFILFLSVPMCFGMIGIRKTLVPWFYGTGYEEVANLLLINSWIIIILAMSSIFGQQILISCNKEKQYTKAIFIDLAVNCTLNAILIPLMYARGALIASVTSEIVCMSIMMYYAIKLVKIRFPYKKILLYVIDAGVMCIAIITIGDLMEYNIRTTMIQIIFGIAIYIIPLIVLKDENILFFYGKLKTVSNRIKH